mmetsp:Transcript_64389/g.139208  ORF Transcript_64389/g.139208 Transcript_64389/m.139208 type:complete len:211 (-) Transcript_64389:43-675(-)
MTDDKNGCHTRQLCLLVNAISSLIRVNGGSAAREAQVVQKGIHLLLVLLVEGLHVAGEDEQEGRKVVADDCPVVQGVLVLGSQGEHPVRRVERSSLLGVEVDLELAGLFLVAAVGITVDHIVGTVGATDLGVVVHRDGSILVEAVQSGVAVAVLLKSLHNDLISGHLVPQTDILVQVELVNGVRVDLGDGAIHRSSRGGAEKSQEGKSGV